MLLSCLEIVRLWVIFSSFHFICVFHASSMNVYKFLLGVGRVVRPDLLV